MHKLIIDQGNTRLKVAVFSGDILVEKLIDPSFEVLQSMAKQTSRIILSTVKKESHLMPLLNSNDIFLSNLTSIPLAICYKQPATLGNDRLALCVGANTLFPNQHQLIIDMGTCLTYDLVNNQNEYMGGAISPGLRMRFQALNQFTSQLPLLEMVSSFPDLIGQSTNECIYSGVINGLLSEIEGKIQRYRSMFPSLKIIVTGGDAPFFDKALKNTIFACPDLLMIGLNKILDYNETGS